METARVIANAERLDSIGIDYDITGLSGEVLGYYPSGYVNVRITHTEGKYTFTHDFDIPSYWLEINKVEDAKDI
jgi:hypothetical protein